MHYGNGPSTLSIGGRELAFAISSPREDGFDLTLDGLKSRVASVIEGHELYLRTRNGRFDLHWVDPFGGDDEEQVGEDKIIAPLPGTVVALLAPSSTRTSRGSGVAAVARSQPTQPWISYRAPMPAGATRSVQGAKPRSR